MIRYIDLMDLSDEKLSALLEGQLLKAPTLKCPSGRPIAEICTRKECEAPSLHCGEEECKCTEPHFDCDSRKIRWITQTVNKRVTSFKDVLSTISEVDYQFTQSMKDQLRKLVERSSLSNPDPKNQKTIEAIYGNGEEKEG